MFVLISISGFLFFFVCSLAHAIKDNSNCSWKICNTLRWRSFPDRTKTEQNRPSKIESAPCSSASYRRKLLNTTMCKSINLANSHRSISCCVRWPFWCKLYLWELYPHANGDWVGIKSMLLTKFIEMNGKFRQRRIVQNITNHRTETLGPVLRVSYSVKISRTHDWFQRVISSYIICWCQDRKHDIEFRRLVLRVDAPIVSCGISE